MTSSASTTSGTGVRLLSSLVYLLLPLIPLFPPLSSPTLSLSPSSPSLQVSLLPPSPPSHLLPSSPHPPLSLPSPLSPIPTLPLLALLHPSTRAASIPLILRSPPAGTQFGMLITYLKDQGFGPDTGLSDFAVSDLVEFYRAAKKKFDEDEVWLWRLANPPSQPPLVISGRIGSRGVGVSLHILRTFKWMRSASFPAFLHPQGLCFVLFGAVQCKVEEPWFTFRSISRRSSRRGRGGRLSTCRGVTRPLSRRGSSYAMPAASSSSRFTTCSTSWSAPRPVGFRP